MSPWRKASTRAAASHEDAAAARVMDSLRRIVRALRVATHTSERELGVSAAQLFVLRQLAIEPGQSLGALAARTRTSQSSVSEVVSRLVAHELVERTVDPRDRRRLTLTLTAAGRATLKRAPETVQERLLAGFASLDAAQREALAAGMEAWLERSGLADVPATMFFESRPD